MNKKIEAAARLLPAIRISLGLVSLTISILLVGDLLGFASDPSQIRLDARKKISEALAIQFSALASDKNTRKIQKVLQVLVDRNPDILTAGLRNSHGTLLLAAGNHRFQWGDYHSKISTVTHVVVPIYRGGKEWGAIEIRFKSIKSGSFQTIISDSTLRMIILVAVSGFLGYLLIIRRTLRELDPSAVIPDRVNAAFNTLAEGVLILDEKEQIVLANSTFSEYVEQSAEALMGLNASKLNWLDKATDNADFVFPWTQTIKDGESRIGIALSLAGSSGDTRTFTVNCAPIGESGGKQRGVLVTFDDVTELEQKNDQLIGMVNELESSQKEVQRQNKELHFLATRDPLTGCMNRRSFNEKFEVLFEEAQSKGKELSCIMADIDHFKSVNDNYGHAIGDKVIKLLADILHGSTREIDLVGRYGGEEFCAVLVGLDVEKSIEVAERIRLRLKDDSVKIFTSGPRVTASLGVASIKDDAKDPSELTNLADQALYIAKGSGRNRVVKWSGQDRLQSSSENHSNAADEPQSEKESGDANQSLKDSNLESKSGGDVKRLQVRIKELEHIATKFSEKLQYNQSYDSLTGLPNQLLFFDRVTQAVAQIQRHRYKIAVLTLDVDLFKQVNSSLGRNAGDNLLKEIANRIVNVLRNTDAVTLFETQLKDSTVSRLTADEFGILLKDLENEQSVTWVVTRIFEVLSASVEIEDQQFYISCNIGISLSPDDGVTAETLLDNASVARQYAKQLPGQNNYQFFDPQMHRISIKQMQTETELRRAIENEEFLIFYQPKLDLQSGCINGIEALIRWNHPQRGILSPYEFIGIAEQRGLIVEIGQWVLRKACQQAKSWVDAGLQSFKVAINLSSVQLREKKFAETVFNILEETALAPQYLEFELTESVIMDNLESALDVLGQFNTQGIWISIDDFGTGYSSLSYLKHLPLNTLKIDRSFICDLLNDNDHDKSIVSTIIGMAHNLNLKVTAEGVETKEQLDLLRKMSCDEIQGYLFSRPMPVEDTTDFLQRHSTPQPLQVAS